MALDVSLGLWAGGCIGAWQVTTAMGARPVGRLDLVRPIRMALAGDVRHRARPVDLHDDCRGLALSTLILPSTISRRYASMRVEHISF